MPAQLLLCLIAAVSAVVGGRAADSCEPSCPAGCQARLRSCLQLQRAASPLSDGVYRLSGLDFPLYCDFSHDGGGWTLLLTAASRVGWDLLNVRLRNTAAPSLTDNYSILGRGDALKALGTGQRFAYRLEGQAQIGRQRWGGVWLAPRRYTLTPETDTQRDVTLVRKFNDWTYNNSTIRRNMPWINVEGYVNSAPLLTTALTSSKGWWRGTLVTRPGYTTIDYHHSPWMTAGGPGDRSGTVLYWIREEELP